MNNPKKVLIFALTYYPKFVGGDGVAIKEITDRISDQEITFDMITLRLDSTQPKFEKFGNVNVYRVGFAKANPTPEELVRFPMYLAKIFFPVNAFLKALKLHKKNKYDLIWAMMVYAGFPAVLFNLFNPKVSILLTLQDGDPIEKIVGRTRIKLVMPLFKRIFKISNHIQAISNYLADFARQMNYRGDISVVPNAVDYIQFSTSYEEVVQQIKEKLNKKENDCWLVTTSRLVEKNGHDLVIKSLKSLPENVKYIVAGIGPDKDKLIKLAEDEKVLDRVIFLGHIQYEDIPNLLKASDIFIRPSRTEGFGNSFVEAMAAGIPVIATTAGGIKDFLFHNENGLEVGIENVEDIVIQVQRLREDDGLKERLIENARDMVREKYDWEIITAQMKTIFKHLTKS